MQEQVAEELAEEINRSHLAVERPAGGLTSYQAIAVVSRDREGGARDYGVRLSAGEEDEFVIWDPEELREARAADSVRRRRRPVLLAAVLAPLLVILFGSRALYELIVNRNLPLAVALLVLAAGALWLGRRTARRLVSRRRAG